MQSETAFQLNLPESTTEDLNVPEWEPNGVDLGTPPHYTGTDATLRAQPTELSSEEDPVLHR